MTPKLTEEQREAVNRSDGCIEVEDAIGRCVLMSADVFREVMGVGTDQEYQESVDAIRRSHAQFEQGRSRPLSDALDDLGRRHGLSR